MKKYLVLATFHDACGKGASRNSSQQSTTSLKRSKLIILQTEVPTSPKCLLKKLQVTLLSLQTLRLKAIQSHTHNSLSPLTAPNLLRNLIERFYKGVISPLASMKGIIMAIYYRIHSCVRFLVNFFQESLLAGHSTH